MKSSVRLNSLHRDHHAGEPKSGLNPRQRSKIVQRFLQTLGAELGGKWRQITIITAYLDATIIADLLDAIDGKGKAPALGNKTTGCQLKIFADAAATTRLLANEGEKSKLVKRMSDHGVDLYSVRVGALFHAKAVIIKTADATWASVGSLNFTSKGHAENEELFVSEKNGNSSVGASTGLARQLEEYVDHYLKHNSTKCDFASIDSSVPAKPEDLRDFFLAGELWYETPESSLFFVSLGLADAVRKSPALTGIALSPFLKASETANTIDIRLVLGIDFSAEKSEKNRWKKRYCIPTCLGLWAPKSWHQNVDQATLSGSGKRYAEILALKGKLGGTGGRQKTICELQRAVSSVWEAIKAAEPEFAQYAPAHDEIVERAEKWVTKITNRLADIDFVERFRNVAISTPMPDLWGGDPADQLEFERSFFDSLRYELERKIMGNNHRSDLQRIVSDSIEPRLKLEDIDELDAKFSMRLDKIVAAINGDGQLVEVDDEDED